MKKIKIGGQNAKKEFTLVDDEDYENLNKYSWHDRGQGYVDTTICENKKYKHTLMHHVILGKLEDNLIVHHINGDTYDNQKENLKITTRQENSIIRKINKIPNGFVHGNIAAEMLGYKSYSGFTTSCIKKGLIKKYKILGTPIFKIDDINELLKPS